MSDIRKWLVVVLMGTIAVAMWWFTRDTGPISGPLVAKPRHDPDYIVETFKGTEMNEQGSTKYILAAQRLTHYPDDDTSHFVMPVLVQYEPGGLVVTTRAQTGVMPGDGKEIVMEGNVHVVRKGKTPGTSGEMHSDRLRVELDR